jgi:hypothetical protein
MDEITFLKTENKRLKVIISALVEQAEILKKENYSLKNPGLTYSAENDISIFENSINNINEVHVENGNDIKSLNTIHLENNIDINNVQDTFSENENGIKTFKNTDSENEKYIKNVQAVDSENEKGIKSVSDSITAFSSVKIKTTKDNVVKLSTLLHKILPLRSSQSRAMNMAYQLLFLHNNGTGTGNDLYRVSSLSKPGFAKHLPKLKRENFIKKSGPGKYSLTYKSQQIIYQAFSNDEKIK